MDLSRNGHILVKSVHPKDSFEVVVRLAAKKISREEAFRTHDSAASDECCIFGRELRTRPSFNTLMEIWKNYFVGPAGEVSSARRGPLEIDGSLKFKSVRHSPSPSSIIFACRWVGTPG
jgi:hypothetical protein